MARILIVDDESGIRELLSDILRDEGFDVTLAENAAAARAARALARPDLVLLDIWMPDTDGITLLKEWAASGQLTMPVIMMSGHGTIDTAVEATRVGALDFLEKPIGMQKLLAAVKKGLAPERRPESALSLAAFPRSSVLRDIKKRIEQLAARTPVVLLRSPAGGIIELVARTLAIPGKPWLDLAQSSQLLDTAGLQAATGGIFYCEELAHLSRTQQVNFQFILERAARFNVHLVAGTVREQEELAALGMDPGLLRYLFEVWLGLPALEQIKNEIPGIATALLQQMNELDDQPLRRFTPGALNALRQHSWPGGYGELRNAVRSLALSVLDEEISDKDVRRHIFPGEAGNPNKPAGLSPEMMEMPLREAREQFERIYLQYHLQREGGNIPRLAACSGLERTHLYRKLKELGIKIERNDAP